MAQRNGAVSAHATICHRLYLSGPGRGRSSDWLRKEVSDKSGGAFLLVTSARRRGVTYGVASNVPEVNATIVIADRR